MMKRLFLITTLLICAYGFSFADSVAIKHFVIKENPFRKDEIAIVATDSLSVTDEKVNGLFTFTMDGFLTELTFNKGVAFYEKKLSKSSFLYLKHTNDLGTHSMLYFIYKHNNKMDPFHISWMLLLAIPLGLVVLGYMFKRFIIIAAVIFCVFLYFNYHNGLRIPTFFESIIDGLKGMF